jgi:CRP/FNR family cyclic AMP-dependent transcriptional regulator
MSGELLSRVPVLARLSHEDLAALAAVARQNRYRREQVIFHRDDPGDSLHIIESGQVGIVLPSEEGEELLLTILGPGEFFGDLSLLDGAARSATAVAKDLTTTIVIRRSDFLTWLQVRPSAATAIFEALARRLRATDELLEDVTFLEAPRRLAKRLLEVASAAPPGDRSGTAQVRLTQDELASLVGLTRESVNKHLRVWQEQGIVSLGRGRLQLLRPGRLRALTHLPGNSL